MLMTIEQQTAHAYHLEAVGLIRRASHLWATIATNTRASIEQRAEAWRQIIGDPAGFIGIPYTDSLDDSDEAAKKAQQQSRQQLKAEKASDLAAKLPQAAELRAQGVSLEQIARQLQIPASSLRRAMRAAGYSTDDPTVAARAKLREEAEALKAEGMSNQNIGKCLNLSTAQVWALLNTGPRP